MASYIVDEGRYRLATYPQEQLKYVEPGQPVKIALDLYPGQIFEGKVEAIWWASDEGQFLPSGTLPTFVDPEPPALFGVKITMPGADRCPRCRCHLRLAGRVHLPPPDRDPDLHMAELLNWLQPLPF